MASPAHARYRYLMRHEIEAIDLEPLRSGLEDEREFRLGELIGEEALAACLAEGVLAFEVARPERFEPFARCVEILSVYLPEYVSGVEVVEDLDAGGRRRRAACWRYVGRSGEVIRVALAHAVGLDRAVVPGGEDLEALRARWRDLPRWARDAYKLTYAELAGLDSGA